MTKFLAYSRVAPVPGEHEIFISSMIAAHRQLVRNGPSNLVGTSNVPNFGDICCRNYEASKSNIVWQNKATHYLQPAKMKNIKWLITHFILFF